MEYAMNLLDALALVGQQLQADPTTLLKYMDEDDYGGYSSNPARKRWEIGSMWEVEGKLLYAILRHTRPERVLEIGVNYACSTTHILAALARNNKGVLTSVDIEQPKDMRLVPEELQTRWIFNQDEGTRYITRCGQTFDVVLEDAGHDYEPTSKILRAAKVLLNPSIVMSHDTEHRVVGDWVTRAFNEAFGVGNWSSYLIDPSDCGIGIWVKP